MKNFFLLISDLDELGPSFGLALILSFSIIGQTLASLPNVIFA